MVMVQHYRNWVQQDSWHYSEKNLVSYRLRLCQIASKAEKGYSLLLRNQKTRRCKSSFDAMESRYDVLGGLEVAFGTSPDKLLFHHSFWVSPVPLPAAWGAFTVSVLCTLHSTLSLQLWCALCWNSERCEFWDEKNYCFSCFMNQSLYDPLWSTCCLPHAGLKKRSGLFQYLWDN